jgi:uncharacterized membrane protein
MRLAMLIIHFIGLAMGIGTGMGYIFLGRASSKLEPGEAVKFSLNTLALSNMGTIGISLLVLSGIYLIIPFWPNISSYPFLIIKLALVVVLICIILINHNYARKAKSGNPEIYLKKLRMIGPFSLLTAVLIVIMAVLNFR